MNAYSENTKATSSHTWKLLETETLKDFCDDKNIWLIEDNYDALGSEHKNKPIHTFGDIPTLSFYQHIISLWVKVEQLLKIVIN